MNRALVIIFVPVIVVMFGYIAVFHAMGLAPGYPRLVIAAIALAAAIWWVSRRVAHKPER